VRCARCGQVSAGDALFCEHCGAKFDVACSSCGASLTASAKFCKRCGAPASDREVKSIRSDSSSTTTFRLDSDPHSVDTLEGERKTVTAMFADIKGSTELMRDLDPNGQCRSGAVFPHGDRNRPAAKRETTGVERHDEPRPGCSRSRVGATRRARCSPRFTTGSPRASTLPT
jgi:hypothetical protein